jgi:hypothetical protein
VRTFDGNCASAKAAAATNTTASIPTAIGLFMTSSLIALLEISIYFARTRLESQVKHFLIPMVFLPLMPWFFFAWDQSKIGNRKSKII